MLHHAPSPDKVTSHLSDTYIDFLSRRLGASREEILEVTKRSGISARRIAEYLVRKFEPAVSEDTLGF